MSITKLSIKESLDIAFDLAVAGSRYVKDAIAAYDELQAEQAKAGWQPIETDQNDLVLVWNGDRHYVAERVISIDTGHKAWSIGVGDNGNKMILKTYPTHWKPLPATPKEKTK